MAAEMGVMGLCCCAAAHWWWTGPAVTPTALLLLLLRARVLGLSPVHLKGLWVMGHLEVLHSAPASFLCFVWTSLGCGVSPPGEYRSNCASSF